MTKVACAEMALTAADQSIGNEYSCGSCVSCLLAIGLRCAEIRMPCLGGGQLLDITALISRKDLG